MARKAYKVIWDNGHACDSFRGVTFTSKREAERFGRDWKREMVAFDENPREARETYSWEVVEVEPEPDPEEDRCDFEGGTVRAALDSRGRP